MLKTILIEIIIIIVLLAAEYFLLAKKKETETSEKGKVDYTKYRMKMLLTKTEYTFYNKAKPLLQQNNLYLYPKVRLEDFVEVGADGKEKMSLRGRIKSRHVDFLLCDEKLHIKAAIELDDITHHKNKAQAADEFKDELFKSINLPLFRIKVKADYTEDIESIINNI